jgi:hypothetical protein
MWNGAAPILINSADISIGIIRWVGVVESVHSDSDLISNILDPNAWARKYLIAASVSWNVWEYNISGINLNKFNSRAAHINIQFEDDRAMIDLISIMVIVRIENGEVIRIKTRQSWTV